ICYSVDEGFKYLQHTCGGRTPDDVLLALAEGMYAMPDYLRELAQLNDAVVSVAPAPGNYPFPGCDALGYADVVSIPGFGDAGPEERDGYLAVRPLRPGCYLFKVLADNVDKLVGEGRITVMLNTAARRLLRADDGSI